MPSRRGVLAAPALLLAAPVRATPQAGHPGLAQGGLVIGRTQPGTRLALDGRALRVSAAGDYAFGFGRDHGAEATLSETPAGGRASVTRLPIRRREWDVQRLSGLPPAQVSPDAAALARIGAERARLAEARGLDTAEVGFAAGFAWPTRGRVSGVFGSQRVLNGEPRQPHYGFDLAVPVGTPIAAMAAGTVTLAAEFFFFGRLIVLDHGHGVNTLYAHLSALDVPEGARVSAGQRIGASGATGRVTGPHLHLSLSWYQTWLDPQPVLPA